MSPGLRPSDIVTQPEWDGYPDRNGIAAEPVGSARDPHAARLRDLACAASFSIAATWSQSTR